MSETKDSKDGTTKYDEVFADRIASLCYNKYSVLGKNGKGKEGEEWSLLAGVVLSHQDISRQETLEVVALGTGTKCLSGMSAMSPEGALVNDSHAEVIARRAFLSYLYEQLTEASEKGSSDLFTRSNTKYKLREEIVFHFFTSHVPCGDASIIPMTRTEKEEWTKRRGASQPLESNATKEEPIHSFATYNHDRSETPAKKARVNSDGEASYSILGTFTKGLDYGEPIVDVHRTGAKALKGEEEKGCGVDYHTIGLVRSKPGRGERTLSVSCSDKIAKWIYLGVQGNLLGLLIESPIRFETVTVGSGGPFSWESLQRGLVSRWNPEKISEGIEPLNAPTFLHSNLIFEHSRYLSAPLGNPCPSSIAWSKMKGRCLLEVIVEGRRHGVTKKMLAKGSGRSKLCKIEFFKKFVNLCPSYKNQSYRQAKDSNVAYQDKFRDFKEKMGSWPCKPFGLENFLAS